MKNNSCIISGATNESRPPNIIVLYTRTTATAPFYSTQAMVELTSLGHHRYIPPSSREHALRLAMARKKGKSRRRKAKHGTPASPAASTQAAARGF
ncbi:unnamed protein product, partial [Ascophyllum nodosum]